MDILIFSKLKIFRSIIFGLVSIFILSACNPFAKNLIIDTKKVLVPTIKNAPVPTINAIAITSPINSSYINSKAELLPYIVAGTCSEEGQTVTIKVDSVVVTTSICTRGSFSGTFDSTKLSEEDHNFTAHTRNVDSAPIIVTRDVIPPKPPSLYSSLPAYTVGGAITAEWVMSESRDLAHQQIQFYTGKCNEEIGDLIDLGLIAKTTRDVSDVRVVDGSTFSYIITSFDAAGNSSTSSCADEMVFYTSKPTIAITTPKGGSYIAIANDSTKFAVNGTCSDAEKSVVIKIDGDPVATTDGVCDGTNFTSTIDSTLIREGNRIFTAHYTDAATDPAAPGPAAPEADAPDAATDVGKDAAISVTRDVTAPTLSGLSDDATPAKTKTWSWGCSETCTYQYVINTTLKTILKSDYGSTATDLQKNGDGTYYIHVCAKDAAGNLSEVSHVSAVIDNTAPAVPKGVTDGTYSSSLTASPAVAWVASRDVVDHYEVAIGTTAGAANVKTWTTATSGNTVTGLTLTPNTTYYASVRALDVAGNISTVSEANGWLLDTTAPSAPGGITLGETPTGTAATPTISWGEATDASGIASYQAQVFLSADDSEVQDDWTTLVSGNALDITLSSNIMYYVQVRAIDNAGNVGPATSNYTWTTASCLTKPYLVNYKEEVQAVTVPTNCNSVTAKVWGAGGGGAIVGTGGGGGFAEAKMRVAPGESLYMYVGGGGVGSTIDQAGGGGGGDSRIKRSTLSMIVGGGGGGAGGSWTSGLGGGNGGPGGDTTGLAGSTSVCTGGAGGTPTAGGAAGTTAGICLSGSSGSFSAGGGGYGYDCDWGEGPLCDYSQVPGGFNGGGLGGGGWTSSASGGGGGSGYYGGGGGAGNKSSQIGAGGGGGGSSYTTGIASSTVAGSGTRAGNNNDPNNRAALAGQGGDATVSGNPGRIVLSWSSDSVPVDAPTAISLAAISTLTQTPAISWGEVSAPGGIASYQAQIYDSGNNLIQDWTTLVSGNKITTVNPLVDGTSYYVKLRAVDNLGNIGTISVASSNWTAGNI